MNAKRFRLIFSKRLGMLVPVAEIATRAKKGSSSGDHGDGMGVTLVPKWNSLCVAMLMTAGVGLPVSGRAQVIPDGTTQTTMTQASNGKPMVDIANPNGGISHNRFTEFNVDANGLLLNNSMQNTSTTMGGMVMLNPHLAQNATGIVAEVTGTNITRLQGGMEIAGQKADLIIANPNGMYVNGLSIINAGNLGLTTGAPDASHTRFDVRGGHIDIDGNVGTQGLDHFDVVARSIRLNGRVTGGDTAVRLAAGLNTFDTTTGRVDQREDSGANAPAIAILGTEAGFMHGRLVTLQSTESGLGVRHEGALTSTANIQVDADGNLRLRQFDATGSAYLTGRDISLGKAGDTVDVPSAKVRHWLDVRASGDVAMEGVYDVEKATFDVGGTLKSTTADLKATRRASNTLGTISIKADQVDIAGGVWDSSDNLTMTARELLTDAGVQITAHHATYTISELLQNRSGILSVYNGGTMKVFAGELDNFAGSDLQAAWLWVDAGRMDNKGNITGRGLLDVKLGAAESTNSGEMSAKTNLKITGAGAGLDNSGQITSEDVADVHVQTLRNTNLVSAIYSVTLRTEAGFENFANVDSETINIHSLWLRNAGAVAKIDAKHKVKATATQDFDNIDGAQILGGLGVELEARHLRNADASKIIAGNTDFIGNLKITSTGDVLNTGASKLQGYDVTITATGALRNDTNSDILAENDLKITTGDDVTNASSLMQGVDVSVTGQGAFANLDGRVYGGDVDVVVNGVIENTGVDAVIDAKAQLDLTGKTLDNASGRLQAGVDAFLSIAGPTRNFDGGTIQAGELLAITSGGIENAAASMRGKDILANATTGITNTAGGVIHATDTLDAQVAGDLQNSGTDSKILAGQAYIDSRNKVGNLQGAVIQASQYLSIKAQKGLENVTGATLQAGTIDGTGTQTGHVVISSTEGHVINADKSRIVATGDVVVDARDDISNTRESKIAGDGIGLGQKKDGLSTAGSLVNDATSTIEGVDSVEIFRPVDVTNHGLIAATDVGVDSLRNVINTGRTVGARRVFIDTKHLDNKANATIEAKELVDIKTIGFKNVGKIFSEKDVNLTIKDGNDLTIDDTAHGPIANERLSIWANDIRINRELANPGDIFMFAKDGWLQNNKGIITGKTFLLHAGKDFDNHAMVWAQEDIEVEAENFWNRKQDVEALGDIWITARGKIVNEAGGRIAAGGDMNLDAKEIRNEVTTEGHLGLTTYTDGTEMGKKKREHGEDSRFGWQVDIGHFLVTEWNSQLKIPYKSVYNGYTGISNVAGHLNVTAAGTIEAGGSMHLNLGAQRNKAATILNQGQMRAGGDFIADGDVSNLGSSLKMSVDEYLRAPVNVMVQLYGMWSICEVFDCSNDDDPAWTLRDNEEFRNQQRDRIGTVYNSLYDFFNGIFTDDNRIHTNDTRFWHGSLAWQSAGNKMGAKELVNDSSEVLKTLQAMENMPRLNQVMAFTFGSDWKGASFETMRQRWREHNGARTMHKVVTDKPATIDVGHGFTLLRGNIINGDGAGMPNIQESVTVMIDGKPVKVLKGDFDVIRDLKDLVQTMDPFQALALITRKESTKFRPNPSTINLPVIDWKAVPPVSGPVDVERPPSSVHPIYETRFEFIDQSKFFGSDYFFRMIGYVPDRTVTVIGDNFFVSELVTKQIDAQVLGFMLSQGVGVKALVRPVEEEEAVATESEEPQLLDGAVAKREGVEDDGAKLSAANLQMDGAVSERGDMKSVATKSVAGVLIDDAGSLQGGKAGVAIESAAGLLMDGAVSESGAGTSIGGGVATRASKQGAGLSIGGGVAASGEKEGAATEVGAGLLMDGAIAVRGEVVAQEAGDGASAFSVKSSLSKKPVLADDAAPGADAELSDLSVGGLADATTETLPKTSSLAKKAPPPPVADNKQIVQALMDNAGTEGKRLGLQLGIAPSEEQLATLDKDIVWMVEQVVDGKKALVPQVFLSKKTIAGADEARKSGVASISAREDVVIKADKKGVANVDGTIRAGKTLAVFSEGKVINSSSAGLKNGGMRAGENLLIDAKGDVINQGAELKAGKHGQVLTEGNFTDTVVMGINDKGATVVSNQSQMRGGGAEEGKSRAVPKWNDLQAKDVVEKPAGMIMIEIEPGKFRPLEKGELESMGKFASFEAVETPKEMTINAKNPNDLDAMLEHAKGNQQIWRVKVDQVGLDKAKAEYAKKEAALNALTPEGSFTIKAKGDVTLVGSDIRAKDVAVFGKNVAVLDAHEVRSERESRTSDDGLVRTNSERALTELRSVGSRLQGANNGGSLVIKAENTVLLRGGQYGADLGSIRGKIVVTQTGKDYREETTTTSATGLSYGGRTGIVGYGIGAQGGVDPWSGSAVDGKESGDGRYPGMPGDDDRRLHQDGMANSDGKAVLGETAGGRVGVQQLTITTTSTQIKNNKAQLNFGTGVEIVADNIVDIGGADIRAWKEIDGQVKKGSVFVEGGTVLSTKYTDVDKVSTKVKDEFTGLQGSASSSIADFANNRARMGRAVRDGQEVDGGLETASIAADSTNLLFNDLGSASVGFTMDTKETTTTSDMSTQVMNDIVGNDITIRSTKGDVNLIGVNIDGRGGTVILDSAAKLRLASSVADETGSHSSKMQNITLGFGAGLGLDGAGAGFEGGYNESSSGGSSSGTSHTNSTVLGDRVVLKSKGDTQLHGANVIAGLVQTDVGGNLEIWSQQDTYDASSTSKDFGVTGGAGKKSLDSGGNYSEGKEWERSRVTKQQSGIVANHVDLKVKGDLHMKGSHIITETGTSDIGGKFIAETIKDQIEKDGRTIGGGGGIGTDQAKALKKKDALGALPGAGNVTYDQSDRRYYDADQLVTVSGMKINAKGGTVGEINTDANNMVRINTDRNISGTNVNATIAPKSMYDKAKSAVNRIRRDNKGSYDLAAVGTIGTAGTFLAAMRAGEGDREAAQSVEFTDIRNAIDSHDGGVEVQEPTLRDFASQEDGDSDLGSRMGLELTMDIDDVELENLGPDSREKLAAREARKLESTNTDRLDGGQRLAAPIKLDLKEGQEIVQVGDMHYLKKGDTLTNQYVEFKDGVPYLAGVAGTQGFDRKPDTVLKGELNLGEREPHRNRALPEDSRTASTDHRATSELKPLGGYEQKLPMPEGPDVGDRLSMRPVPVDPSNVELNVDNVPVVKGTQQYVEFNKDGTPYVAGRLAADVVKNDAQMRDAWEVERSRSYMPPTTLANKDFSGDGTKMSEPYRSQTIGSRDEAGSAATDNSERGAARPNAATSERAKLATKKLKKAKAGKQPVPHTVNVWNAGPQDASLAKYEGGEHPKSRDAIEENRTTAKSKGQELFAKIVDNNKTLIEGPYSQGQVEPTPNPEIMVMSPPWRSNSLVSSTDEGFLDRDTDSSGSDADTLAPMVSEDKLREIARRIRADKAKPNVAAPVEAPVVKSQTQMRHDAALAKVADQRKRVESDMQREMQRLRVEKGGTPNSQDIANDATLARMSNERLRLQQAESFVKQMRDRKVTQTTEVIEAAPKETTANDPIASLHDQVSRIEFALGMQRHLARSERRDESADPVIEKLVKQRDELQQRLRVAETEISTPVAKEVPFDRRMEIAKETTAFVYDKGFHIGRDETTFNNKAVKPGLIETVKGLAKGNSPSKVKQDKLARQQARAARLLQKASLAAEQKQPTVHVQSKLEPKLDVRPIETIDTSRKQVTQRDAVSRFLGEQVTPEQHREDAQQAEKVKRYFANTLTPESAQGASTDAGTSKSDVQRRDESRKELIALSAESDAIAKRLEMLDRELSPLPREVQIGRAGTDLQRSQVVERNTLVDRLNAVTKREKALIDALRTEHEVGTDVLARDAFANAVAERVNGMEPEAPAFFGDDEAMDEGMSRKRAGVTTPFAKPFEKKQKKYDQHAFIVEQTGNAEIERGKDNMLVKYPDAVVLRPGADGRLKVEQGTLQSDAVTKVWAMGHGKFGQNRVGDFTSEEVGGHIADLRDEANLQIPKVTMLTCHADACNAQGDSPVNRLASTLRERGMDAEVKGFPGDVAALADGSLWKDAPSVESLVDQGVYATQRYGELLHAYNEALRTGSPDADRLEKEVQRARGAYAASAFDWGWRNRRDQEIKKGFLRPDAPVFGPGDKPEVAPRPSKQVAAKTPPAVPPKPGAKPVPPPKRKAEQGVVYADLKQVEPKAQTPSVEPDVVYTAVETGPRAHRKPPLPPRNVAPAVPPRSTSLEKIDQQFVNRDDNADSLNRNGMDQGRPTHETFVPKKKGLASKMANLFKRKEPSRAAAPIVKERSPVNITAPSVEAERLAREYNSVAETLDAARKRKASSSTIKSLNKQLDAIKTDIDVLRTSMQERARFEHERDKSRSAETLFDTAENLRRPQAPVMAKSNSDEALYVKKTRDSIAPVYAQVDKSRKKAKKVEKYDQRFIVMQDNTPQTRKAAKALQQKNPTTTVVARAGKFADRDAVEILAGSPRGGVTKVELIGHPTEEGMGTSSPRGMARQITEIEQKHNATVTDLRMVGCDTNKCVDGYPSLVSDMQHQLDPRDTNVKGYNDKIIIDEQGHKVAAPVNHPDALADDQPAKKPPQTAPKPVLKPKPAPKPTMAAKGVTYAALQQVAPKKQAPVAKKKDLTYADIEVGLPPVPPRSTSLAKTEQQFVNRDDNADSLNRNGLDHGRPTHETFVPKKKGLVSRMANLFKQKEEPRATAPVVKERSPVNITDPAKEAKRLGDEYTTVSQAWDAAKKRKASSSTTNALKKQLDAIKADIDTLRASMQQRARFEHTRDMSRSAENLLDIERAPRRAPMIAKANSDEALYAKNARKSMAPPVPPKTGDELYGAVEKKPAAPIYGKVNKPQKNAPKAEKYDQRFVVAQDDTPQTRKAVERLRKKNPDRTIVARAGKANEAKTVKIVSGTPRGGVTKTEFVGHPTDEGMGDSSTRGMVRQVREIERDHGATVTELRMVGCDTNKCVDGNPSLVEDMQVQLDGTNVQGYDDKIIIDDKGHKVTAPVNHPDALADDQPAKKPPPTAPKPVLKPKPAPKPMMAGKGIVYADLQPVTSKVQTPAPEEQGLVYADLDIAPKIPPRSTSLEKSDQQFVNRDDNADSLDRNGMDQGRATHETFVPKKKGLASKMANLFKRKEPSRAPAPVAKERSAVNITAPADEAERLGREYKSVSEALDAAKKRKASSSTTKALKKQLDAIKADIDTLRTSMQERARFEHTRDKSRSAENLFDTADNLRRPKAPVIAKSNSDEALYVKKTRESIAPVYARVDMAKKHAKKADKPNQRFVVAQDDTPQTRKAVEKLRRKNPDRTVVARAGTADESKAVKIVSGTPRGGVTKVEFVGHPNDEGMGDQSTRRMVRQVHAIERNHGAQVTELRMVGCDTNKCVDGNPSLVEDMQVQLEDTNVKGYKGKIIIDNKGHKREVDADHPDALSDDQAAQKKGYSGWEEDLETRDVVSQTVRDHQLRMDQFGGVHVGPAKAGKLETAMGKLKGKSKAKVNKEKQARQENRLINQRVKELAITRLSQSSNNPGNTRAPASQTASNDDGGDDDNNGGGGGKDRSRKARTQDGAPGVTHPAAPTASATLGENVRDSSDADTTTQGASSKPKEAVGPDWQRIVAIAQSNNAVAGLYAGYRQMRHEGNSGMVLLGDRLVALNGVFKTDVPAQVEYFGHHGIGTKTLGPFDGDALAGFTAELRDRRNLDIRCVKVVGCYTSLPGADGRSVVDDLDDGLRKRGINARTKGYNTEIEFSRDGRVMEGRTNAQRSKDNGNWDDDAQKVDRYAQRIVVLKGRDKTSFDAAEALHNKHRANSTIVMSANGVLTPITGQGWNPNQTGDVKVSFVGEGHDGKLASRDAHQLADDVKQVRERNGGNIAKVALVSCDSAACDAHGNPTGLAARLGNKLEEIGIDTTVVGREGAVQVDKQGHKNEVLRGTPGSLGVTESFPEAKWIEHASSADALPALPDRQTLLVIEEPQDPIIRRSAAKRAQLNPARTAVFEMDDTGDLSHVGGSIDVTKPTDLEFMGHGDRALRKLGQRDGKTLALHASSVQRALNLPLRKVKLVGCKTAKCDDSGRSLVHDVRDGLAEEGIDVPVKGYEDFITITPDGHVAGPTREQVRALPHEVRSHATDPYERRVIGLADTSPEARRAAEWLYNKHADRSVLIERIDGKWTPTRASSGDPKTGDVKVQWVGHGDGKSVGGRDASTLADDTVDVQRRYGGNIAKVAAVACDSDCDPSIARPFTYDLGDALRAKGIDTRVVGRKGPVRVDPQGGKRPVPQGTPGALGKLFTESMSLASMQRVGDKPSGHAEGGQFRDAEGRTWFVKSSHGNEDFARNEVLAAKLLQMARVPVPEVRTIDLGTEFDGGIGIASAAIQGAKEIDWNNDEAARQAVRVDFAAQAFVGNWDAIGLMGDNYVKDADGELFSVDHGGALRYRSLGDEKGAAFADTVGEIESMRDPKMAHPLTVDIFGKLSSAELRVGMERVVGIGDEALRVVIERYGPRDDATRNALFDTLIARKSHYEAALKAMGVGMPGQPLAPVAPAHGAFDPPLAESEAPGLDEASRFLLANLPRLRDAHFVGLDDKSKQKFLFRGDDREPARIFEEGFEPRARGKEAHTDLTLHQYMVDWEQSNLVATSRGPEVPTRFASNNAQKQGWVYVMHGQTGLDMNKHAGSDSVYAREREVVVPDGIRREMIVGAYLVRMHEIVPGSFVPNPHFEARFDRESAIANLNDLSEAHVDATQTRDVMRAAGSDAGVAMVDGTISRIESAVRDGLKDLSDGALREANRREFTETTLDKRYMHRVLATQDYEEASFDEAMQLMNERDAVYTTVVSPTNKVLGGYRVSVEGRKKAHVIGPLKDGKIGEHTPEEIAAQIMDLQRTMGGQFVKVELTACGTAACAKPQLRAYLEKLRQSLGGRSSLVDGLVSFLDDIGGHGTADDVARALSALGLEVEVVGQS